MHFVTKSPLTGLFLDSHVGGFVGPELKFANYDAIIVEGKSEKPCYISIINDEINIHPAKHLKGLATLDKEIKIKNELNEPKAKILSIGLAGENLVKYACVTSDSFRNAGRGGSGAVFGSKNLLAIAIRGSKKEISVANQEQMNNLETNLRDRANTAREGNHWLYETGTPALLVFSSESDQLPVENFQKGTIDNPQELSKVAIDRYETRKRPCYKCAIQCAHIFDEEFAFKENSEHITPIPEYETLGLIGSNCGVKFETVVKANYLANMYGLDTISLGSTCAFFMECCEKNLVPEQYEQERVLFGDDEGLIQLIHKIAKRKGIGQLLAEGTMRVAKSFEHDTEKFAIHVKGLEMAAWDPRGKLGLGLSYATAAVGASHLRGWPSTTKLPKDENITPELVKSLVEGQDLKILKDALIICHFTHSIIPALDLDDVQKLYEASTGKTINVREIAQNIWSLTRYFNMREYEKEAKAYDTLPHRLMYEPLPTGSAAGSKAFNSLEDFNQGLMYLYQQRCCDSNGNLSKDEITRIEKLLAL